MDDLDLKQQSQGIKEEQSAKKEKKEATSKEEKIAKKKKKEVTPMEEHSAKKKQKEATTLEEHSAEKKEKDAIFKEEQSAEKKKKEATPKKEKEKENKTEVYKYFFLYFIEAHSTDTSVVIKPLEEDHTKDLEAVKNSSLETSDEKQVDYTIYKLKVAPTSGMKSLKINFNLLVDDEANFKSEIELKEFSHDIFYYDFIYSPEKGSENEKIDVGKILSHLDQFRIYLSYLKEIKKEKNSKEIDDLALSTRKHLTIKVKEKGKGKGKDNKYHDLSLYFMVVAACYESPSISKIISDFYLKRVNKKYFKNLSKEEKETISKIFNDLEKNPEPALNKIENPEDKVKNKRDLFFIILCFRLFNKEDFQQSLNNILNHNDTKNVIYIWLTKYPKIFKGILSEKKQISNMVKKCENFRNIKRVLSNITSILDYFDIILENLEHIFEIRQEEINKKEKTAADIILEIDGEK